MRNSRRLRGFSRRTKAQQSPARNPHVRSKIVRHTRRSFSTTFSFRDANSITLPLAAEMVADACVRVVLPDWRVVNLASSEGFFLFLHMHAARRLLVLITITY
uniref:(northern house mosquito) hypothetical protein n=1 Tax=Culex pipiens TaxID=7175 RepID=A0A8D8NI10_CULPI